ncbi:hypothetical protein DL768_010099 [Monosporascus sp. mg162]|nr:hypothetical protein DL768_010099 [Monosporascus sp. mg162]
MVFPDGLAVTVDPVRHLTSVPHFDDRRLDELDAAVMDSEGEVALQRLVESSHHPPPVARNVPHNPQNTTKTKTGRVSKTTKAPAAKKATTTKKAATSKKTAKKEQAILHLSNVMEKKLPSPPKAVAWPLRPDASEAILGKNPRNVVAMKEMAYNGPLRGVVKIISKFRGGHTVIGTGVLINGCTVATVGHLLIDEDSFAKNVVILAGKGGGPGSVESRDGICAAVHHRWYNERWEPNDLGFVHLWEQFDTVNPIKFGQTPLSANGVICGYSGDMPYYAKGDRLCKSMSPVRYIPHPPPGMVEHEGDTEKGNSGGPVFDAEGTVIALHRGWAYKAHGKKINEAVAINRDGNDFAPFGSVLAYMVQHTEKHTKGNIGGEVGRVDFEAQKEGRDICVKVVEEAEKVGGLAFTW